MRFFPSMGVFGSALADSGVLTCVPGEGVCLVIVRDGTRADGTLDDGLVGVLMLREYTVPVFWQSHVLVDIRDVTGGTRLLGCRRSMVGSACGARVLLSNSQVSIVVRRDGQGVFTWSIAEPRSRTYVPLPVAGSQRRSHRVDGQV